MPATALVTSAQYLALADEFDQSGNRIKDELIGGEIVKMPPASLVHDRIKNQIGRILFRYLDAHPATKLEALIETGAEVSPVDVFVPDISVIRRDRLNTNTRILAGPPELAVEVVSPSDTASHLKAKVDAYLSHGAKTVWVVYPESKSVIVYSVDAMRELKADQKIEDPLLPGFSTQVSAFFELP